MKKIFLISLITMFVSSITLIAATQSYTWKEGKDHIGEEATVCGKIKDQASVTDENEALIVVGLGAPVNDQECFGLEFKTDVVEKFQYLKGEDEICVTGTIRKNPRGTGSMRIKETSQIKIK